MKLTKSKLKQIIKEELSEALDDNALIEAAYQDISIIDAQRGVESGAYKLEHVAEALRKMAEEFDTAAAKESGWEKHTSADGSEKWVKTLKRSPRTVADVKQIADNKWRWDVTSWDVDGWDNVAGGESPSFKNAKEEAENTGRR